MQSFESSCRRSASLEPIEKRLRRVQPPDQVFTGGGDSHRALNEAYSRQTRAIVETGHESVGHNTRVALRGVLREVARMRAARHHVGGGAARGCRLLLTPPPPKTAGLTKDTSGSEGTALDGGSPGEYPLAKKRTRPGILLNDVSYNIVGSM